MKRLSAVNPDHQIVSWESVKESESRTLGRNRVLERKHREERVNFTLNKERFE